MPEEDILKYLLGEVSRLLFVRIRFCHLLLDYDQKDTMTRICWYLLMDGLYEEM